MKVATYLIKKPDIFLKRIHRNNHSNSKHTWRFVLNLAFFCIIGFFLFGCQNNETFPQSATTPSQSNEILNDVTSTIDTNEMTTSQDKLISGTVLKNNLGCIVDANCYLQVLSDDKEIIVLYSTGRGIQCANIEAGNVGIEIKEGDEIEVFGKIIGVHEISTCDSQAYYIKKLP